MGESNLQKFSFPLKPFSKLLQCISVTPKTRYDVNTGGAVYTGNRKGIKASKGNCKEQVVQGKSVIKRKNDRNGGYTVTLLGMTSGKNLSKYERKSDGEFMEDPRFTNIFKMNGGVYLSVTHSTFFESDAYHFDEKSGEITRNKEYNGLNALFQLPFDTSKADEKAAEEQLRKWEEEADAPDDTEEGSDADKDSREWDEKRLKEEAKLLPKTVETLTPDKDGYIYTKKWSYKGLSAGKGTFLVTGPDGMFDESETGLKNLMITQGSNGKSFIETCTKNEDGTVTVAVYREK